MRNEHGDLPEGRSICQCLNLKFDKAGRHLTGCRMLLCNLTLVLIAYPQTAAAEHTALSAKYGLDTGMLIRSTCLYSGSSVTWHAGGIHSEG